MPIISENTKYSVCVQAHTHTPKKTQKMVNSDYLREVTLQKILMLLFIPFCVFYILNSHTLS